MFVAIRTVCNVEMTGPLVLDMESTLVCRIHESAAVYKTSARMFGIHGTDIIFDTSI